MDVCCGWTSSMYFLITYQVPGTYCTVVPGSCIAAVCVTLTSTVLFTQCPSWFLILETSYYFCGHRLWDREEPSTRMTRILKKYHIPLVTSRALHTAHQILVLVAHRSVTPGMEIDRYRSLTVVCVMFRLAAYLINTTKSPINTTGTMYMLLRTAASGRADTVRTSLPCIRRNSFTG